MVAEELGVANIGSRARGSEGQRNNLRKLMPHFRQLEGRGAATKIDGTFDGICAIHTEISH